MEGPSAVASRCDRILLSLPTTQIVEEVLRQMGHALKAGKTIVDTTTGDPQRVEQLGGQLEARGVG